MNPERKDPSNPGYQHPQGNPAPQNPPHEQYPNPSTPQPGQQYQHQPQYPSSGGGDPRNAPPQSPTQQYPPQGQYPPGENPSQAEPCTQPPPVQTTPPQTPCPEPTPPPAPEPPYPCKGVPPPTDPGCYPPKTPSEEDCTPKDPCAEYYETHDCSDYPEGPCKCKDRPCGQDGLSGTTIRQQLTTIEALVTNPPPGTPPDASKKLEADLKELEDEYKGLAELITKFETDRATIECTFTTKGRKWYEEIHKLCDTNVNCDITHQDIKDAYDRNKQHERDACCAYIHKHYEIRGSQNCKVQAEGRETEAKADLTLLKGLSTTFIGRLADLEDIFKKAVEAADKRRFKTVCGLKLEFDGVWFTLFQAETWCFRRKDCCICCPRCDLLPNTLPCWTVERYRDELQKALKAFIAAKYNHYLWNVYWLRQQADYDRLKADCEKAHANRRERFLAEAEEARDCPAPSTPTGDCGCGKQHKKE